MRKGSTSFGACEVRCWLWLFGNKLPTSLDVWAISLLGVLVQNICVGNLFHLGRVAAVETCDEEAGGVRVQQRGTPRLKQHLDGARGSDRNQMAQAPPRWMRPCQDQHLPNVEGRCKATWKREFKLPWREAGPPNHHDDKVVSDLGEGGEELQGEKGVHPCLWEPEGDTSLRAL